MQKINSIEQDDYQAVFRWDEYQEDDPRFLQGILMEHYRRHSYSDEAFRAEDETIKLLFDDSPDDDERTHSILVTGQDLYSKVIAEHEDYDMDHEDARHISIMQDRMESLHGRAASAESIYEIVTDMADDDAEQLVSMLDDGPILDENALVDRCDEYDLQLDTVIDVIEDEPMLYPNTEQASKQRSIDDYIRDTKQGESMQTIYHNVIDVVKAAYHQDKYFN